MAEPRLFLARFAQIGLAKYKQQSTCRSRPLSLLRGNEDFRLIYERGLAEGRTEGRRTAKRTFRDRPNDARERGRRRRPRRPRAKAKWVFVRNAKVAVAVAPILCMQMGIQIGSRDGAFLLLRVEVQVTHSLM